VRIPFSLVSMAAIACSQPSPEPASTPPAPERARPLFRFQVGKWLNLHQRLYALTSSWRRNPYQDLAGAVPEDPDWQAAMDHYRTAFVHDHPLALLGDPTLVALNRRLSELGDQPLRGIDPVLAGHLQRAAALVDADWPDAAARSRAWIAAVEPWLARHGAELATELEKLFQAAWPEEPIRVDVSIHAGPVGAYTVLDPAHITISSSLAHYQGDAGLEMLFHEASHALVAPLREKLTAEFARQGAPEPPQLWHALLFYTTGEVVRRRLGAGYVPYADKNRMWTRGLASHERPIKDHWPAYLDGAIDLDTAIARVVAAHLKP
jgi:hypothetical protein